MAFVRLGSPIPILSLSVSFFYHPPTPEIYTLSLHDALPIFSRPITEVHFDPGLCKSDQDQVEVAVAVDVGEVGGDRKSTRLNSSHMSISYAVFCLKKKKHHTYRPSSYR